MHTARLKENGKEVVIKVIRPDILPIIKADMEAHLPPGALGTASAA
ncbi:AarF/UbiB family protein [Klebsiella pneumoniae]